MKIFITFLFLISNVALSKEFIVRLKTHSPERSFVNALSGVDSFTIKKRLKLRKTKAYLIEVKSENSPSLVNQLRRMKEVAYVEPNYEYFLPGRAVSRAYTLREMPTDDRFEDLWGLHNDKNTDIDALDAWKKTKGVKQVVVGVVDTGISLSHPDLKENLWFNAKELNGQPGVDDDGNGYIDDMHGYDFYNDDADPTDGHSHGSHCAGTIAAVHNNAGVAGVSAHASLMAVKIFSDRGRTTAAAIAEGITYAVDNGAHVLSNSWGGGGRSEVIFESIKYANEKGVIFVAAAGNSSQDNDRRANYPSNYDLDNIIAVAAYDVNGDPASFTSYGKTTVDVAAPGVKILSTVKDGKYAFYSGTSMATPHVSGIAALVLSLNHAWLGNRYQERNLNFDPKKMRDFLIRTSVPTPELDHISVSGGRVNVGNAFKEMLNWFAERNR